MVFLMLHFAARKFDGLVKSMLSRKDGENAKKNSFKIR